MFIDKAEITIKAGNGGNGCCSFRREAFIPNGGPSGGDGGNGGDVIFVGDPGAMTLLDFTYNSRFMAPDGSPGKGKDMTGRNGKNLLIPVPPGTIVRLKSTGDLLADVNKPGQQVIVARGGKGGRGNARFATATNQAPREHEPGEKTEFMEVTLELKVVADIGFVGYPNAGKSTLLSDLSSAKPKIAPYPFTTLQPVVGVVEYDDFYRLTIADIPGLVDGASENVGLGHEFLRHIERTKMLVYVLDMAGVDGPDRKPWTDLEALERELELYEPGLSDRAKLIVANKMDLPESRENLEILLKKRKKNIPVFPLSAMTDPDYEELKTVLREFLSQCPEPPDPTKKMAVFTGKDRYEDMGDEEFEVHYVH